MYCSLKNASLLHLIWTGFLLLILTGFSPFSPPGDVAQVSILHVATSGSDSPGCGSYISPCRSIQYAVNQAPSGAIILVASGTYTYNSANDPCPFLYTRAVVCFVDKQLTILGGYSVQNWTHPDPTRNLTIIDGQNQYRGVVVVSYNATAKLRMEGFIIQNGKAQGKSSGTDWDTTAFGGGMWAQNSAVELRDMVFSNNIARGGDTLQAYGGAASGGGLAIQSPRENQISVLERVAFQNNQAIGGSGIDRGGLALGGGLFTYQAVVYGDVLTFTNNLARAGNSNGSGVAGRLSADALGGGAAFQHESVVVFKNLTAAENTAIGGNAGAYAGTKGGGGFGGAFHAEEASFSLTNAWIRGNQVQGGTGATGGVGFGGGLELLNSNVDMNRVWVLQNEARSGGSSIQDGYAGSPGGGGAYLWGFQSPPYLGNLKNVVFADNRIVMSTGRTDLGGGGGGLVVQGMNVDITHCTFARNQFEGYLRSGQAILVHGTQGAGGLPGIANIRYSIIADHVLTGTTNTSALTVSEGSTANLYKNLFANNTNDTNLNSLPLPPGTINGYNTSIFASSAGFISPGSPDYDYHIAPTSPAVGKAEGSTTQDDIDGQSRPYGEKADVGADEYVPPMLSVMPQEITILTEGDASITRRALINVENTTKVVTWTATTSASWLFLGPSGTAQEVSGQSGEWLQLWFKPEGLAQGTYQTDVLITSSDAEPVTLKVRMLKVEQVFSAYLPLILRQSR